MYIVLGFLFATALIFVIYKYMPRKSAGISIKSNPDATVYIDGEELGRTPFERNSKAGDVTIKLIPDSFETPLAPYEIKTTLYSGAKTQINRNFGESIEKSSGYIANFEKIADKGVELSIGGNPENVEVQIDGRVGGYTPFSTNILVEGKYKLNMIKQGYAGLELEIDLKKGNRLSVVYDLSKSVSDVIAEETSEEEEDDAEENKPEDEKRIVEITSTPTGFLRVRAQASTGSEELARVKPTDRFSLIEKDENGKWYKIEYKENKTGWVSAEYAKIISEKESPVTPTPTKKATPTGNKEE